MEKTIPELTREYGVNRDTLRKAALRGEFPSRKSGERAHLIDDETQEFREWLQSRERKVDTTMTKWIDEKQYYRYPIEYPNWRRAARAAQKLENQLKIFAETATRYDDNGNAYFVVITRNDVPHK